MPKYVIERTLPDAGSLSGDQWRAIAEKSNGVLATMGGRAQWQHSYVTGDKLFCVYLAEDPEALREHGAAGGFPVDAIHQVAHTIDPTTAEG